MPKTFSNTFLKPGRYHIGGDRWINLTADRLRRYAKNTNAMIKAGLNIPLFSKHAKTTDEAGGPAFEPNDSKDCIGSLVSIKVNNDGSLTNEQNIKDSVAIRKVEEGAVQYTSPELVENFMDSKGRKWGNVFRHFALTPTPRNIDQTALTPATQFSIDEHFDEKLQISLADGIDFDEHSPDDTPNNDHGPAKSDPPDENLDMPTGDTSDSQKVNEAIIARLAEVGIVLASGVDLGTPEGMKSFLSALMSHTATKDLSKAEKEDEDKNDDSPLVSTEPSEMAQQFSETDKQKVSEDHQTVIDANTKLVAQLSEQHRVTLLASIDAQNLPPVMVEKLKAKIETVQFDEGGEDEPSFSVSEVVALFAETVPENLRNLETATVDEGDKKFLAKEPLEGNHISSEEAEQLYTELHGEKRWKGPEPTQWVNQDKGPLISGGSKDTGGSNDAGGGGTAVAEAPVETKIHPRSHRHRK